MNEILSFDKKEFGEIQVIDHENKVWFGATLVAKLLKYSNPHDAIIRHCREDGVVKHEVIDSLGRVQKMKFIDEGNIYRLIVRSKLPSAEKFERWVFDEVLPSVRKHGMYATDELLDNPEFLIKTLQALMGAREETKHLLLDNSHQKQIIGELKFKAEYFEMIMANKGLVTITQIAKDYGMSGYKMNTLLHELGIQYKQSKQWLLFGKYQDKGYVYSQTVNITRQNGTPDTTLITKWTQRGRVFLYDLLKIKGIVPMLELDERNLLSAEKLG